MTENDCSQNIKKRLEELQKWQDEQQKILNVRLAEREIKSLEQRELRYQLGILPLENKINKILCKENESDAVELPKRKYLKKGEGLKNRFKIDPDLLRLHNLPKYKYAARLELKPHLKNKEKCNSDKHKGCGKEIKPIKSTSIYKGEIRDEGESICESFSANQEFKYVDLSFKEESLNMSDDIKKNEKLLDANEHMNYENPNFYADAFDHSKIQSVLTEKLQDSSLYKSDGKINDSEDLCIFELIEKKTQQDSFNINVSLMQKWIQERANAIFEKSKGIEKENVTKQINNILISPFLEDTENSRIEAEYIENCENTLDFSENDIIIDSEQLNKFENYKHKVILSDQTNIGHVRFCEEVQINEVNSDQEITVENLSFCQWKTADNCYKNKSIDQLEFEEFKKNLFSTTTINYDNKFPYEANLDEQISKISFKNEEQSEETIKKTQLLKNRLVELENEILIFRENNSELLRLKQEHELNRIQLEQERLEIQEKFNDIRIKHEIRLHDERLKIEEDKKKLEKMIREQKIPNRKERDEILKLREEIETLQKELRNRDSKHVAAQARLRAQIRNLEKELKDLNFEIENLKKENKKLENENARMTRQNNNKMLQEINKTIAKLAVKPSDIAVEEVQNTNVKPITAKVISHKRKSVSTSLPQKVNISKAPYEHNDSSLAKSSEEEDYSSSDLSEEEKTVSYSKNKNCQKSINKCQKKSDMKITENKINFNNSEFKREIEHPDGSKDIWYPNGNLKKISADGMNIKMLYFNKDIKETNISEGTVRYYYAEKNTWHTTYLDGLEILEFPNGQTEHRYKNGTVEVHFPNGSIRVSNPSDQYKLEEWRYADGTNSVHLRNGDKVLSFPNGQKEIHTKIHKRREYPDGTVKIVYPDGSQETRYSNGRIRLKDKDGNLIMDSENNKF